VKFNVENYNRINNAVAKTIQSLEEFEGHEILAISEGIRAAVISAANAEYFDGISALNSIYEGIDKPDRADPEPRVQDKWVKDILKN